MSNTFWGPFILRCLGFIIYFIAYYILYINYISIIIYIFFTFSYSFFRCAISAESKFRIYLVTDTVLP